MASYITKEVAINSEWSMITDKPALIQFTNAAMMSLGDTVPTGSLGFYMNPNEKYVNTTTGVKVWARSYTNGIGLVRLAEESII